MHSISDTKTANLNTKCKLRVKAAGWGGNWCWQGGGAGVQHGAEVVLPGRKRGEQLGKGGRRGDAVP